MIPNIGQMMKQMQAMQEKMAKNQEELALERVEGVAGGGLVTITVDGLGNVKDVVIDSSLMMLEEKDTVQELLVVAFKNAKNKADEKAASFADSIKKELKLPPGFQF